MRAFSKFTTERGSALLIVLGFLSFMMISAVSFAVYMRIERQASSNYRHATTARHLLNAGLYRAIDEIDAELRVPSVSGTARALKFPDWPGRVRSSAVPNGERNGQDARVLSLEALSFIPGILVNDVRRYAIPNEEDPGYDKNDPSKNWRGAKWRPLSMPSTVFGGEQVEIGRYAYVCVNVSDMLDVNVCKAAERDSVTNRISIGHLFADDGKRTTFDSKYNNPDRHYETLQDFYACMYQRNDPTFGSPYHEYLKDGSDGEFDVADNHVLITDSIVKAEPKVAGVCNILYPQRTVSQAVTTYPSQLKAALISPPSDAEEQLRYSIADYLDMDNKPYSDGSAVGGLFRPSLEMVPMVYEIGRPADTAFVPTITSKEVDVPGSTTGEKKKEFYLTLAPIGQFLLPIKFIFPFKYLKDRQGSIPSGSQVTYNFQTDVEAFLVAERKNSDTDFSTSTMSDSRLKNMVETAINGRIVYRIPKPSSVTISLPQATESDEKKSFIANSAVMLNISAVKEFPLYDSKGVALANSVFGKDDLIRVALVVFVGVKNSNGVFVDQAPGYWSPSTPPTAWDACYNDVPGRLFFQTQKQQLGIDLATPRKMEYEWKSLEVADPRFNHKASNWFSGNETVANAEMNPATLKLLGKDGRDGDIYMFVSDSGKLSSPGEFGFIVRPYPNAILPDAAEILKSHTVDTLNPSDSAKETYYMFRTIRLYDHGNGFLKDKVYDYFTAKNADETLSGARVNPLSDLPNVIISAIANTPVDYFWAGAKNLGSTAPADDIIRNHVFEKTLGSGSWGRLTNAWIQCFSNARKVSPLNISWQSQLSDIYGDTTKFGWYSNGDEEKIFAGGYSTAGVPANLSDPLHEIDRKMLYSFTLDSFSDRQQLFLYFIRAEATVPSFGGGADGGVKSLAGGRAVALVWRDPYPQGYAKGTGGNDSWLNKGSKFWYSSDHADNGSGARVSPWYQHNLNKYDESKDDTDEDGTFTDRLDGFHQHRILFFKQLDN